MEVYRNDESADDGDAGLTWEEAYRRMDATARMSLLSRLPSYFAHCSRPATEADRVAAEARVAQVIPQVVEVAKLLGLGAQAGTAVRAVLREQRRREAHQRAIHRPGFEQGLGDDAEAFLARTAARRSFAERLEAFRREHDPLADADRRAGYTNLTVLAEAFETEAQAEADAFGDRSVWPAPLLGWRTVTELDAERYPACKGTALAPEWYDPARHESYASAELIAVYRHERGKWQGGHPERLTSGFGLWHTWAVAETRRNREQRRRRLEASQAAGDTR